MTSVERRVLEVRVTDYYSVNTFKYVYFFGINIHFFNFIISKFLFYYMYFLDVNSRNKRTLESSVLTSATSLLLVLSYRNKKSGFNANPDYLSRLDV